MRVRIAVVAAAACGLFALSGCQFLEKDEPQAAPTSAPTSSAKPTPSGKATPTGKATGKTTGGSLPNPCTLLTKAEVSTIAGGKQVTQVDEDGEKDGATTRYCQWQLSGGQLAIFLSKTSKSEFEQAHGQHPKVSGVGDQAATDSGHLYVLHGDILIDSYARSSNEGSTAQMAKNAALKVIAKL